MSIRQRFWSKVAAIVLGMGCAGYAGAQEGPTSEQRSYINKSRFHLPLQMDDGVKGRFREIHLFVKDSPAANWRLVEKITPGQAGFNFQPAKEGEYLFAMVMVDRGGKMYPADLSQLVPGQVVVVDLKAPHVDAVSLGTTDEGHAVQVDVRDANCDASKTQFQYQTKDQVWRSLDGMPGLPNRFTVPGQAATTGMIRVTASDLAGNTTRRDFDLANLAQSNNQSNNTVAVNDGIYPRITLPTPGGVETPPVRTPAQPQIVQSVGVQEGPMAIGQVIHPEVITPPQKTAFTAPQFPGNPTPGNPAPGNPAPGNPAPGNPAPGVEGPVAVPPLLPGQNAEARPQIKQGQVLASLSSKRDPNTASVPRRLINQTQLLMEYQLEQVGASGVGKVEVWMTRDNGQSWHKLGEDADCKSPVAIELPGEGVFGVSLVVSNGRGFGAVPPSPGDTPETWIEVDVTKPAAELTSMRAGTGDESGAVMIQWTAQDKNMPAECVDLYFSSSRDGNWQSMVKNFKNEGRYRWVPPANLTQAYVRFVVHDLTGNTTTVESQQPVLLDDQSRPRGRLVSVTPIEPGTPPPPSAPMGN